MEGYRFPYVVCEIIEGARLSHNWKVQALGHVLLLASKNADLDDSFQEIRPLQLYRLNGVGATGVPNQAELESDPGSIAPARVSSRCRIEVMERTVRFFGSAEDAEAADIGDDLAMSPEQRVAIVFELQARIYPDAAQQGFARVYRIAQREQC